MCWTLSSPARGEVAGGAAQPANDSEIRSAMARITVEPVFIATPCSCSPSAQRDGRAHDAGFLMAREHIDPVALLRAHDPFDLEAIVGDVVVRTERHAGVLVRF